MREADVLAGMIGVHGINPGGSGEIGYMASGSRGRGLLTEVGRAAGTAGP